LKKHERQVQSTAPQFCFLGIKPNFRQKDQRMLIAQVLTNPL